MGPEKDTEIIPSCDGMVRPGPKTLLSTLHYQGRQDVTVHDMVATEAPLDIYIDGYPHYLTMRLPGDEATLAIGYCFSEGIIDLVADVISACYVEKQPGGRVEMTLNPDRCDGGQLKEKRRLPAYSSCGLCGKQSLKDFGKNLGCREKTFVINTSGVNGLLEVVEQHQVVFPGTGGTHAAAVFDKTGECLSFSEDVGRHNALDKAIGRLVVQDDIQKALVVVVTSRLSFEMVQKVGRTPAQVLIGMSSATSLGVELARQINLTLIGFARKAKGTVYTGQSRVVV